MPVRKSVLRSIWVGKLGNGRPLIKGQPRQFPHEHVEFRPTTTRVSAQAISVSGVLRRLARRFPRMRG